MEGWKVVGCSGFEIRIYAVRLKAELQTFCKVTHHRLEGRLELRTFRVYWSVRPGQRPPIHHSARFCWRPDS